MPSRSDIPSPSVRLDPVEAFFAGISSGVVRALVGLSAIVLGFGVCILPIPGSWHWESFPAVAILAFTSLFRWASLGGLCFVGLCALVGMFAFLHAFMMERAPKFSLFAVFTCAALYLAPVTFSKGTWLSFGLSVNTWGHSVVLYLIVAATYWTLPYVLFKFSKGKKA